MGLFHRGAGGRSIGTGTQKREKIENRQTLEHSVDFHCIGKFAALKLYKHKEIHTGKIYNKFSFDIGYILPGA